MRRRILQTALIGMVLVAAGCLAPANAHRIVYEDQYIDVPEPVPEERVEAIPPPPNETVVWKPGHWRWERDAWVWIPGEYVARPHPEAAWVPGHWVHRHWGWTWVPGYWL